MHRRVASGVVSWYRGSAKLRSPSAPIWLGVIIASGCVLVTAWTLAGSSRARSLVEDNASVITDADTSMPQSDSALAKPLVVDAGDDRPASETKLSVGDQLKVTVFERLEEFSGPGKTGKSSVGLVEQTMVSGEYLVEESGHIVLPLLGAISASDLMIGSLAREIRRGYAAVFRRDAMVSVTITERRPVYLLGPGFKAGAYKFTSGMTVLHLLALAGADDDRRDVYLQSERLRQKERYATSMQRLEKALARSIVLRAERDGGTPAPTSALLRAAGSSRSATLIEGEVKIRQLVGQLRQSELDATRSAIATARQGITTLDRRVAILTDNSAAKKARRETLSKLAESRDANPFLLSQVSSELYDVEDRRQEALLALSQAQRKLEDAEGQLSRLVATQKLELEKEISVVEQEIADAEIAATSSQRLVQELGMQQAQAEMAAESARRLVIVRQGTAGSQRLDADELTPLKPGDLVQIRAAQQL